MNAIVKEGEDFTRFKLYATELMVTPLYEILRKRGEGNIVCAILLIKKGAPLRCTKSPEEIMETGLKTEDFELTGDYSRIERQDTDVLIFDFVKGKNEILLAEKEV